MTLSGSRMDATENEREHTTHELDSQGNDSGTEQSADSNSGDSLHSLSGLANLSFENVANSTKVHFGGLTNISGADFTPNQNFRTASLFDTPESVLQSPKQYDVFAPQTTHNFIGRVPSYRCTMCNKNIQHGPSQFTCAHRTCQVCAKKTTSCVVCGAGEATVANFPPQMFLSPTVDSNGGLSGRIDLLDTSFMPPQIPKTDSRTNQSAVRAFSFSTSSPMTTSSQMRHTTTTSGMNVSSLATPIRSNQSVLPPLGQLDSLTMWAPLQSLQRHASSISPPSPLHNVFDSLCVNDDVPVFSPLSPTNTSHILPALMSPQMPIAPAHNMMALTQPHAPMSAPLLPHHIQPSLPTMVDPTKVSPNNKMPVGTCQGCVEGNISCAFCLQCQDALCAHCVNAHQRVRATRLHRVVGLPQLQAYLEAQFMQQEAERNGVVIHCDPAYMGNSMVNGHVTRDGSAGSLGDGVQRDHSDSGDSSPRSSSVCSVHDSHRIVCVCSHCASPLCAVCVASHTAKHMVQPVGDMRVALHELTSETRALDKQCESTADAVRRMAEAVRKNARTAENDITKAIYAHVHALEERRKELLSKVETVRDTKLFVLDKQAERLAKKRVALQQALQQVDEECNDESKLRQMFHQLASCQMGGASGEQNNTTSTALLACHVNEDDAISFVPPANIGLLATMRQFGSVESGPCAKTSAIVGDGHKKSVRERHSVIYVQLRDACGEIIVHSHQQVAATGDIARTSTTLAHVQALVTGPDGFPLDVALTPREKGVVAVSYFPMNEGSYNVNILVRGVPITGSPTTIEVRSGRNYDDIANKGPLFTFGREGSGDGELCRPWGICVDLLGRVLVADRSNNRIQIFDKDGNYLSKFGTSGQRSGQFDRPAGITTNTLNNIIVADKDNHRVQVFDENGNFLLKFGDRGRAVGYFNYPWGVATNSANAIAVSDTRNHRVQIFTPQGQFVRKCGFDSAYFFKNLDSPRGLCYLPDGQLLITDFNNHRLAVLSPRNMSEMKVYGSEGDADGMFVRPQGVKTDPEGHILVCDSRNNRIQVFSSDDMRFIGSFGLGPVPPSERNLLTFQMPAELPTPFPSISGPFGGPGFTSTPTPLTPSPRQLLDRPTDLAVGPDGRIYVVDFGNNCIRVF